MRDSDTKLLEEAYRQLGEENETLHAARKLKDAATTAHRIMSAGGTGDLQFALKTLKNAIEFAMAHGIN